jgi:hypothetical protein
MLSKEEGKVTETLQEGQDKQQDQEMVKCTECIYLVHTRHHISKQILGFHCFSIGRQQACPEHYNFDGAEVEKGINCEWFESITSTSGSRDDGYAPKIQRFVTIRVRWGYDWEKAETSDEEVTG